MPLRSPFGSSRGAARAAGQLPLPQFSTAEWEQLVQLPARVIAAAASLHAPTDEDRLATLAALAAGRIHDSELLRAIVARIYRATEEDAAVVSSEATQSSVLAACREASRLLALRADPADAAAYRQWLQSLVARCFGLTRGTSRALTPGQRDFLDQLAAALAAR